MPVERPVDASSVCADATESVTCSSGGEAGDGDEGEGDATAVLGDAATGEGGGGGVEGIACTVGCEATVLTITLAPAGSCELISDVAAAGVARCVVS